jgi:hypothetical protein
LVPTTTTTTTTTTSSPGSYQPAASPNAPFVSSVSSPSLYPTRYIRNP